MFNFLLSYDYKLMHWVNVKLAHPDLDQFWLLITQVHKNIVFKFVLLPLLLLRLIFVFRAQVWKLLLMLTFAVAAADMISYRVIKQNVVQRQRPFENPQTASWVRQVGDAHGPSFPSNHAANVAAGALILGWYFPSAANLFYIFALLVCYSRIALGVHYPSDVIAGAAIGLLVGFTIRAFILNPFKVFSMANPLMPQSADSASWRTRRRRMKKRRQS